MTAKKDTGTIAALAVVLKDGSHRLSVPGWRELEYVQERGYPVNVFARSTTRVENVIAEVIREAVVAARMAIPPEDPADKRVVWTPTQVAEAIDTINPSVAAVMDYGSIRAHLAALLIAAEPTEHWTDDSVAEAMVVANLYKYAEALQALYDAAFPRRTASTGGGAGES